MKYSKWQRVHEARALYTQNLDVIFLYLYTDLYHKDFPSLPG